MVEKVVTNPGTKIAGKTITIEVPPGVDPATYAKSFQSYQDYNKSYAIMEKAKAAAVKELKLAHSADWVRFYGAELTKRGIDPAAHKLTV